MSKIEEMKRIKDQLNLTSRIGSQDDSLMINESKIRLKDYTLPTDRTALMFQDHE